MSFIDLPNELVILVGEQLPARDVYYLSLVNRRLASLLSSRLRSLATLASHSFPALYWSVLKNNRPLVEHILSTAPNITIFKSNNRRASVVLKSPAPCDPETLEWIMSQQGQLRLVDLTPLQSTTALSWAIMHEHYPLLKLVLDTRAYGCPASAETALVQAAQLGREKAVRMLLEHGVNPDGEGTPRPRIEIMVEIFR